jgi:hypothetical protein
MPPFDHLNDRLRHVLAVGDGEVIPVQTKQIVGSQKARALAALFKAVVPAMPIMSRTANVAMARSPYRQAFCARCAALSTSPKSNTANGSPV